MTVEPSRRDPALVLLSGGLDSATMLAVARRDGFPCIALSFDYGQRHRAELDAARRIARDQGVVDHRIVRLDADVFRGSALTDDLAVPKDRNEGAMGAAIPPTYVPARNTVFLSHALALAEVVGSRDLFIGVNAVDYSGYPDCRPQYIEAFERMANLATRAATEGTGRLRIHAPLIELPKIRIIQLGLELGVDYSRTHSCYDPDQAGRPCLRCDACLLRMRAFEGLGLTDPLVERLEGRPARSA